jgi:methyl-accepting chemotaxis protein
VKLAENSSIVISELVPSIRTAADLVHEVAAVSSEQALGVSQMNKAMSRVDELTQRNAAAAEELASTSEELAAQAETLQQLMRYFQIAGKGNGSGRPAEAPPPSIPVKKNPSPRMAVTDPALRVRARAANASGHDDNAEFTRF